MRRRPSLEGLLLIAQLMRLPGGTDAQVAIGVVARIVVDVEAVLIEVAHVDEVVVGRLHLGVLRPLRSLSVILRRIPLCILLGSSSLEENIYAGARHVVSSFAHSSSTTLPITHTAPWELWWVLKRGVP